VAITITGDVDAADRARVRTFAEQALAGLGVDLDVPIQVVAHNDSRGRPNWPGWATTSGVFLRADELDDDDDELRWLVAEEVAHFWFVQEHGDDWGDYPHELFATWFVSRHCDTEWEPPDDLDEADSYQLGRLVGGALAGSQTARERLDRVDARLRRILLDLVDRLDGDAEPQAFAAALAGYHNSPVTRLAAKLERRGYEPPVAAAAAKAAAKKLGREHAAWARAAGLPEQAELLDALAESEAAGRWRDEHVSGFGGNRDHVPPIEEATARLRAAHEIARLAGVDVAAKVWGGCGGLTPMRRAPRSSRIGAVDRRKVVILLRLCGAGESLTGRPAPCPRASRWGPAAERPTSPDGSG
jgi:hypothetical protein